jgi:uncharacterized protein YeaO (DUF488 family)
VDPSHLYTKRWNDLKEPTDGLRILVTRYRPRGLPKSEETWDAWLKDLAPSADLVAAYYGKHGRMPVTWEVYRAAYVREMRSSRAAQERIRELAAKVAAGEAVTLLCSSACERESRCHRSLLRDLILAQVRPASERVAPDRK